MSEKVIPNETTLEAIKEVEQMKTNVSDDIAYINAEQMVKEILNEN